MFSRMSYLRDRRSLQLPQCVTSGVFRDDETHFFAPVFTSIPPMAVAIAAGNAVLFKPSEQLTALSALLAELFPKYLDPEVFACVNGSIPETTRLLELRWDHSELPSVNCFQKLRGANKCRSLLHR